MSEPEAKYPDYGPHPKIWTRLDERNAIIEECARECERLEARGYERGAVIIMSAAIRALKEDKG